MASVDWKKIKGSGEAKAMFRHCDKDERMKRNHNNLQIKKNLSSKNISLFGDSYADKCSRYDAIIDRLDSTTNKNKRKDRVTMLGLEIPLPEGMNDERDIKIFLDNLLLFSNKTLGEENLVSCDVHFDEVHEYINSETKEKVMSRPHIHMYYVPVDQKGNLNAKSVSSRKNMIKFNKEVEKISNDLGYRFMTGTKRKSTKEVEELKNESQMLKAKEELKKEALIEAQKSLRYQLEALERDKAKLEEDKAELEKRSRHLEDRERLAGEIIDVRARLEALYDFYVSNINSGEHLKKLLQLQEKVKNVPPQYYQCIEGYMRFHEIGVKNYINDNKEVLIKEKQESDLYSKKANEIKRNLNQIDSEVLKVSYIPAKEKDDNEFSL